MINGELNSLLNPSDDQRPDLNHIDIMQSINLDSDEDASLARESSVLDVQRAVCNIKNNCATGVDEIPGEVFKNGNVITFLHKLFIRGIKHDFPFINIRKVPMEVLITEGEARGFQPSRGTLRMLMNDKIMFDRYYCINSTKHCENEENIGAPYFPTRVRYA